VLQYLLFPIHQRWRPKTKRAFNFTAQQKTFRIVGVATDPALSGPTLKAAPGYSCKNTPTVVEMIDNFTLRHHQHVPRPPYSIAGINGSWVK
jgi:hypothetical protein